MKLIIAAMVTASILPSAAYAGAGPSYTSTADASATVVAPLDVHCDTDISFGQLAPLHDSSATVTISPDGASIQDPLDIVVPGSRQTATPGNCHVTGEAGLSYHVTFGTTATLSHGSDTMNLTNFQISSESDGDPYNRLLVLKDGIGANGFGVGATLTVGANQPPGLYTGTYVVQVQYN